MQPGYRGHRLLILTLLTLITCYITVSAQKPTKDQPTTPIEQKEIKIYLVFVGDNGQNGKKIGCDDSLIAISRNINPGDQLLKATIEELLKVPQASGEGNSLNNFWVGEKLKVDSVHIKAGIATIRISGMLSVAGVCDEPRIITQIEQTAQQFTSVKKVKVFLNGQPLAKAIR